MNYSKLISFVSVVSCIQYLFVRVDSKYLTLPSIPKNVFALITLTFQQ